MTWPVLKHIFQILPESREQIELVVSSPMLSGFFLSVLLAAPYSNEDITMIRNTLLWKEVSVMESIPRKPTIDWYALFSLSDPLHERFRPSPVLNRHFRYSLKRWISTLQRRVLYPSMGNRSVSTETRVELEYALARNIDIEVDVTSTVVEHYYSRSGIQLKGGCEMRQKWYPTQSSPRTYYAQGGVAYHSSKYLRDAFNLLCDTFRPTNRYERVSPSGMTVNEAVDDVFIYDLTSFTSLFHEHASFLHFLATITEEVDVIIFDSWKGPLTVSLGHLIYDYLEKNVLQPSYTTRIPVLSDLELHHSIAGFLGVFGNLATCTFPHGLCLASVSNSLESCWCAGDDAGSREAIETSGSMTMSVAEVLGTISKEKTFTASQMGAIALKRPIGIAGGILYQRPNILWPIFSVMCDADPRFNLPNVRHATDRVTGAIVSFLKSCQRVPLSPSDIEFACSFFLSFYQRYHLPESGWYPPLTGYEPWKTTIPRIERSVFGKDPLHILIDSFFGTEYTTTYVGDYPWDKVLPSVGEEFMCNSEKHLTYLERLGYISSEPVTVTYPGEIGKARAYSDAEYGVSRKTVYQYTIIETIPDHLVYFASDR